MLLRVLDVTLQPVYQMAAFLLRLICAARQGGEAAASVHVGVKHSQYVISHQLGAVAQVAAQLLEALAVRHIQHVHFNGQKVVLHQQSLFHIVHVTLVVCANQFFLHGVV